MKSVHCANFVCESRCFRRGFKLVIGVDEAGRGPLAGPVLAAAVAVVLPINGHDFADLRGMVRDSKEMAPAAREAAYRRIIRHKNLVCASASIGEKIIDKINILEASKLAMARAVGRVKKRMANEIGARGVICLIDGNFAIKISGAQKSIVGGDARAFSIAAASVVAKVRRDRLMEKIDKLYPEYGFARHKGYGTKKHLAAIEKYGLCSVHRRTFAPCTSAARKGIMKK
ncbi:MAG TPA: ribonuclease HII [Candidatus Pacearchaeota archaeon]|nr:ribonuclease HII [Candidatus Pacearchaeota archaeon]